MVWRLVYNQQSKSSNIQLPLKKALSSFTVFGDLNLWTKTILSADIDLFPGVSMNSR